MGEKEKKWKILPGFQGKKRGSKHPAWLYDVLANRGIDTEQEISSYLDPKYEDLLPTDTFLNMGEAVEKIAKAREKSHKVTVYGDYDVDGITATALVREVLGKIGVQDVETYIPHREEEGYGLNKEAVDEIITGGTKLLITVDCGVTSKELIDYLIKKKVEVLVCDHHEIEKKLLPATIVIHPDLIKKGQPAHLCACGMAFFLAKALSEKYPSYFPAGQEKWLLDLVALATICDVVPLTGQNRILAGYGLRVLGKTKRIGLSELIRSAGTTPAEVNSYAVGFLLGPRINAAGRLEHAKKALELLTTDDKVRASSIAYDLGKLNMERQKMCEKILEEAKAEIESSDKKDHEIFLLANKHWPRGVVGIIASKLSDAYARPVIVFEDDGNQYHGSARSIEGFDITAALGDCKEHICKFGGHAKAAGLTVEGGKFILFKDKLLEIAKRSIKKEDLTQVLIADTKIEEAIINDDMVDTISGMEPFGYGNHTPTFVISGAEITGMKKVGGGGEHLKFNLKKSGLSAIFFNAGREVEEGRGYDLLVSLRYNFWNQRRSVEVRVIDLRESEDAA